MRPTRKTLTTATAVLLLACLLVACGDDADTPSDDAPADGSADEPDEATGEDRVEVLRLAGGDFGYPTPFRWVRGPGRIHAGFLFDTLLWEDSTGEPIPWLAEDWEVSDDGLEWTFTLHEDIQWHDGEELTADDVVFTADYLTEGPGGETGQGSSLAVVDEVTAPDDRTVVFHLPEPYAAFEEEVAMSLFVLPAHVWEDVDDPDRYDEDDATMGSGPYHLVEADEAQGSYLYEANDDFFLGAPLVTRLEFVPAPDELLALERGEIDAAEIDRDPVPEEQMTAFEAQFARLDGSGDWNHALHFNLEAGFPYDERDFRQAVAYAIDQEDLVDRLLLGRGVPGSPGALAPTHPMHANDLPSYDYDPERAAELLDGLGITDADGDGTRDLPEGEPLAITLRSSSRFSAQDPELVAEYLGEVGLDVTVEMLDRAAADEAGAEGNYTMALQGYGGLESDPDLLRTRFHSEAPARGHSSVHGYANEEFDELAEQQLATVDPDERAEIVADMQHILAEDLPLLSLYVPTRLLFYDEGVLDAYYYTPGCSPCRGTRNKHLYVTGQQTGIPGNG